MFEIELNQTRIEQTEEIVITIFENKIKRRIASDIADRSSIHDDFFQIDDVLMGQLTENLNLSNSRDGKTFFLVFQSNFFQRTKFT